MDCSDGGCLTAAVMFGVDGVRVLAAGEVGRELHLLVETVPRVEGCRSCGVVAVPHRRREHLLRDAPFGHRPVVVMWRKRMFRCAEPACPVGTFSEEHPLAAQRAALTGRAIAWAVDALEGDDTTVSALARRLGVGWHTLWRAAQVEAAARLARPGRLDGVDTLGVDEHVWRPGRFGTGRDVTVMVDLTRGPASGKPATARPGSRLCLPGSPACSAPRSSSSLPAAGSSFVSPILRAYRLAELRDGRRALRAHS